MASIDDQFNSIADKLQQLLKDHQRLKKENGRLRQELEQCRQQQAASQLAIDELQQHIAILKSATGELSDKDKKAFEKRLNHYIKAIDKCISFLSQ